LFRRVAAQCAPDARRACVGRWATREGRRRRRRFGRSLVTLARQLLLFNGPGPIGATREIGGGGGATRNMPREAVRTVGRHSPARRRALIGRNGGALACAARLRAPAKFPKLPANVPNTSREVPEPSRKLPANFL
jgi:hypothetical protein